MSLWIINAVKNMSLFLQLSPKNLLRDYIKWGPYFGVSNRVSILLRRQSCLDKQPKQSLNSWPNNSPFVFVNKNEAAHTKITTKACNKSAIISLNNKSYETNLLRIAKKGERKSSTAARTHQLHLKRKKAGVPLYLYQSCKRISAVFRESFWIVEKKITIRNGQVEYSQPLDPLRTYLHVT